jgi:xanthine dehydrogenase accessory factor
VAAIEAGQPRMTHYTYRETEEGGVGICGGENDVFIDVLGPARELLIVGAGHVGQAVAELGAFLGMDCIVLDHRPEYANQQRFPRAARILVGDIVQSLRQYPVTRQTYITIVTRGHVQDTETLGVVIHSPAAYIGMIGSRRKTGRVFEVMRAQGVEQAVLDRIHAPIGLEIGAETPEEIAVSIVGQIIAVMRGKA